MNMHSRVAARGTTGRPLRLLAALVLSLALCAMAAHAAESGFRHKYLMRGQVLDIQGTTLIVCVGTADGAQIGQELNVVRHERIPQNPKFPELAFRRKDIGKVRITSIFDEHYAKATVIEGEVQLNDTVELPRR